MSFFLTFNSISLLKNQMNYQQGFSDYIASSYSRNMNQWNPSDEAYNWVFNWDGHNEYWTGRITNLNTTYGELASVGSSIHKKGQLWSTCNMKSESS